MDLHVGMVLEGKVTGITKFGAFVQLPDGVSGLVHISEIANAFVNDVNDYLTMGQTVTVKIIGINDAGKINLSIKQLQQAQGRSAEPPRPRQGGTGPSPRPSSPRPAYSPPRQEPPRGEVHKPTGDVSFEDKLKQFMQESDSKMSGNKLYADRRGNPRRRK